MPSGHPGNYTTLTDVTTGQTCSAATALRTEVEMSNERHRILEDAISPFVETVDGYFPRPWFTRHDPMDCTLLLVGASSAKSFPAGDLQKSDLMNALFNRAGTSCCDLYQRFVASPSPSRQNLDRAIQVLEDAGWRVMQTNVTCASAALDSQISPEARRNGTELFKAVMNHVPWRAMVIFGSGAAKRFRRITGVEMPPMADADAQPIAGLLGGKPFFVIPTLAYPGYRSSVWRCVSRCVSALDDLDLAKPNNGECRPNIQRAGPALSPRQPLQRPAPIVLLVGTDTALQAAARGLDLLLADHPELELRSGSSQISLWAPLQRRLFRIKRQGSRVDLLIHRDILAYCEIARDHFDMAPHKNTDFLRLFSDDTSAVKALLNRIRQCLDRVDLASI